MSELIDSTSTAFATNSTLRDNDHEHVLAVQLFQENNNDIGLDDVTVQSLRNVEVMNMGADRGMLKELGVQAVPAAQVLYVTPTQTLVLAMVNAVAIREQGAAAIVKAVHDGQARVAFLFNSSDNSRVCARTGCSKASIGTSAYCSLACQNQAEPDSEEDETRHDTLISTAWQACRARSTRAPGDRREQLRQHLISASVTALPHGDALEAVDALLRWELLRKPLMDSSKFQRLSSDPRLALWKGDITTLRIDGILNAANEGGLGCFQPMHRCIDNVIHCAAGPSLRVACDEEMSRLGMNGRLPTGEAIVTPAFNLPSRYVIHVPGPVGEQPALLSKAYVSVLNGCKANGIKSVAMCCLSTGIFGYPADRAAEVAVATVRKWLDREEALGAPVVNLVVFNTFLQSDLDIYMKLLV